MLRGRDNFVKSLHDIFLINCWYYQHYNECDKETLRMSFEGLMVYPTFVCAGKVGVPKQLVINKDPSSIPGAVNMAGLRLPIGNLSILCYQYNQEIIESQISVSVLHSIWRTSTVLWCIGSGFLNIC